MASTERAFTVSNGVIHYGAALSSYAYQYDACNNLTKLTCSVAGTTWNTVYTYDKDNRPKKTTLSSGVQITNTYNALGLVSSKTIGLSTPYETKIYYLDVGDGARAPLIEYYKNGNEYATKYEYDDNGNISRIVLSNGTNPITYEYDAANRLTRENNRVTNETVTYEYDDFGNILNKKIYAYTTGTLPATPVSTVGYTYANSGWKDQLTSYNGQTITYDAMGNPLTYRGYTFTWQGKQLMSSVKDTQTISFEYNEDGLRQKKTVNGTDTDYFYNGSVLIGMQRGTSKFLFSYDASGNVVSVKYNGNEYYYVRNGQGDIVKLIDNTGTTVVEYIYNTWGKKVTTTGSLAGTLGLIQPFRYRGYVYDWETGFYYLQSRYYDPTTGRFISADVLLSTGQGVLGHNAFAYCLGNPVNMVDEHGMEGEDSKNVDNPLDFLRRLLDIVCKYIEPDQFVYDPSPRDDKIYKQFKNDVNKIIIAYNGSAPNNEVWLNEGSYLHYGIHIHYGGKYSYLIFREYIEKWGMQKLASNIAQMGIDKYRLLLGTTHYIEWNESELAEKVLHALVLWRDGEYAGDEQFFVSYND